MDYSLAALKLLCAQLKNARQTPSQNSFTLGGILFQRAWIQSPYLRYPTMATATGRFLLDDGTAVIELFLSRDFRNRHWELGMYLMVVGGYCVRAGDLPLIKVHKIVDLSPFPDRESMWYLEVVEAFKFFYEALIQE